MFHSIDQNTDEWLEMRGGKVTGSAISKIMANGDKAFGEPAKRLAVDIAIEQIKGAPILNNYSNDHMERGHEQEPIARALYEDEYFCSVDNGGFFDNGFTGCSPDGLVNTDGVVEIKSVIPSVQYKTIKRGAYDPSYRWQLVFNLKETGRDWIDYISFCAEFPVGNQLFIERIQAESLGVEFDQIEKRLAEFFQLVEQVKSDVRLAA